MNTQVSAQIGECRDLLWRGEQAVRSEEWKLLPSIQRSYAEAFDRLRATLEHPFETEGVREELVELERHQLRLVREFRQRQQLVNARLDDLNELYRRLERRERFASRLGV